MSMKSTKKIAFVCSYKPRKCGIATFTSDLITNVGIAGKERFEPNVIAMQSEDEHEYAEPVRLCIRKDVKYDYIAAADYINRSDVDLVSIQHEFGLFGGEAGSYLSLLLERINKPSVTTLHTVLERPTTEYFDALVDVCEASDKVVVMNARGVNMLHDIYSVPERKIELIPHGIPDLPFIDSNCYKHRWGLHGRRTILTFGLLSENKGIEVMLRALPSLVETDPSILYIVLGSTHPEVLRRQGPSYILKLKKMVVDFGLQNNVIFHHRFVNDDELFQFLGMADIYVTPYLHKEQLTSGTLAFAVGTGKAVVSTPYWAAEELLAQGRGKIVPFGDSQSMARSIMEIIEDGSLSLQMRRRAYMYGRSMTWPKVGQAYWKLFEIFVPPISTPLKIDMDLADQRMPVYSHIYG